MNKEKLFNEAMDYIAGTCMTSPIMALEAILGTYPDTPLIVEECTECEYCGWWSHPGESCDCEEESDDNI